MCSNLRRANFCWEITLHYAILGERAIFYYNEINERLFEDIQMSVEYIFDMIVGMTY